MKIFFAGGASIRNHDTNAQIGAGYGLMKNHLITWINGTELKLREKYLTKDCDVLIDSGAFSLYTRGVKINLNEYKDFIIQYQKDHESKINSLNFINLDKIGDSKESWNNQHKLEKIGVNPIPVVHQYGFKKKYLDKAMKEYPFFALGGMWGRSRKLDTIPWLEYVFKEIMIWVKKGNKLPKIHLLGIGSKSVLMKFPAYSCDNTNWMTLTQYGFSKFLKIPIPKSGKKPKNPYKHEKKYKYNKLEDQRLLKKLVDHEIKRYKDLEKQITEFWQKRGIVFNG